ncbi:MAG TPA: glycosyltransferase family 4 protein [Polyangiales bacterium]|nr:glycosyltransferase family 4 protein [Polyangiales bacterium]
MLPPRSLFSDTSQQTLVIVNQVYVPDPASVGQHMHDVAVEMTRRGWRVIVLAADSGYEDPTRRYARYELLDGVHVLRVPFASFGKSRIAVRLAGAGVFLSEATALALALRRIDSVLVSTSPPMCALAGLTLSRVRRVPLTYWIMDLNPDQIVALGAMRSDAAPVRALDWLNRQTLERARRVIALDRFMAERVTAKLDVSHKLSILPPWPHLEVGDAPLAHADNPFRAQHGFGSQRVVMYSGNLSPVHPLDTFLEAARAFADDPRLRFVFVGGGLGREQIERVKREAGWSNLLTLPYQPLAALPLSLSAADVHLVAMGDAMVGIVHPCKIYGAMAAGRPILALCPARSHVGDLVARHGLGWQTEHGDVPSLRHAIAQIAQLDAAALNAMGLAAQQMVRERFSRQALIGQFCDLLS